MEEPGIDRLIASIAFRPVGTNTNNDSDSYLRHCPMCEHRPDPNRSRQKHPFYFLCMERLAVFAWDKHLCGACKCISDGIDALKNFTGRIVVVTFEHDPRGIVTMLPDNNALTAEQSAYLEGLLSDSDRARIQRKTAAKKVRLEKNRACEIKAAELKQKLRSETTKLKAAQKQELMQLKKVTPPGNWKEKSDELKTTHKFKLVELKERNEKELKRAKESIRNSM